MFDIIWTHFYMYDSVGLLSVQLTIGRKLSRSNETTGCSHLIANIFDSWQRCSSQRNCSY